MSAHGWLLQLRRRHPLRVHLAVILLLKIAALIAIHHYFFAAPQRTPIDRESIEQRLLQSVAAPADMRQITTYLANHKQPIIAHYFTAK